MAGLEYRVIDRSILLPAYRRWLVDPVLPHLPASLDPNAITHAGHVANLAGMVLLWVVGQDAPWACVIAMLGLQLYLWCDNADGAHARRTGQTSVYGEFLDHGLDQLNTAYIGCLTAMALVVSPAWFVATVLLTSGAAVVTYWEQSVTGVFRLGLLNQVESLMVLSLALTITAVLGPDVWAIEPVAGVSIRDAMLAWMTGTILFGALRALIRVAQHSGLAATGPIAAFIGLSALIVAVASGGQVPWWAALAAAGALDVFYGMRMLALRFAGQPPRFEPIVIIGALMLSVILLGNTAGLDASLGPAAVLALAVVLVGLTVLEARRGLERLGHLVVVALVAVACGGPWTAWAVEPCKPASPAALQGGVRAPVALEHLKAHEPIVRVHFPQLKSRPLLVARGRACLASPAGARALGVLPPLEDAREATEWVTAFEEDAVVLDPDAVRDAIVKRGGRAEKPGRELARGVVMGSGFVHAAVLTVVDGTASLWARRYDLVTGLADDVLLARLSPPAGTEARLASSGPMVREGDSPAVLAHAEAVQAIRALAGPARGR